MSGPAGGEGVLAVCGREGGDEFWECEVKL